MAKGGFFKSSNAPSFGARPRGIFTPQKFSLNIKSQKNINTRKARKKQKR